MAVRGGPTRRIPTNPLSGVMRQQARAARAPSVRRAGPPGPAGAPGPAGPPGRVAVSPRAGAVRAPAVAVVVTGDDGRARIDFAASFLVPPVLTALPVDPDSNCDRTVLAVLEEVTATYAVVRVWRTRPRRGQGVADPAGPGVAVHCTATEPPGDDA